MPKKTGRMASTFMKRGKEKGKKTNKQLSLEDWPLNIPSKRMFWSVCKLALGPGYPPEFRVPTVMTQKSTYRNVHGGI